MVMYLVVVYGLGSAWVWWVFAARGSVRIWLGATLLAVTVGVFGLVWRRARRLRSRHEAIGGRLITHGGAGGGSFRWSRRTDDDGTDFETHSAGGW